MILEAYNASRTASMNSWRSPSNFCGLGPGSCFDARTLCSFIDDNTRASTAALMVETTTPLVNGGQQRPFTRPFLAGLVQDHVHQRLAGFAVFLGKDVGGDLDQETVQVAPVPGAEHLVQLLVGEPSDLLEDGVGFADELHVPVLDPVVHHLDVMASAVRAHVAATGLVIDLGGNLLEDGRYDFPGAVRTARHERRAFERAFLPAGDAHAQVVKPQLGHFLLATLRVSVQRVAAIDDDVALLQLGNQLLDDRIDRSAGLDHDHDLARARQALDQLLDGAGGRDALAPGAARRELLGHRYGAVENRNRKAFAFQIE